MIQISESGEKHLVYKLGETEKEIRHQLMRLVLDNNNWNLTHTAKSLGIQRTAFMARIKKLGWKREEQQ